MGVWIDADMGFDDLVSILIVDHSALEIDGLSLVVGNSTMANVAGTAARAAAAFGWTFPIAKGRETSVLGRIDTAEEALGATGIRTAGHEFPPKADTFGNDAFDKLCAYLDADGPRRILALGPLTNIAALALARPDLAARIDDLTWMGGSVTGGNITPHAEFNAFADPESLAIVLAHGLPIRMVDLDFCRRVQITHADVPPVREAGGALAPALGDYLSAYVDISLDQGHAGAAIYDAVTALAFVRDDLVGFEPAHIAAETCDKPARGRTTVTFGSPHSNGEVATELAENEARSLILGAILREARR